MRKTPLLAPLDTQYDHSTKTGLGQTSEKLREKECCAGAAIPAGQLIDAGNVYASKTFYDNVAKRQILFGWVHEVRKRLFGDILY